MPDQVPADPLAAAVRDALASAPQALSAFAALEHRASVHAYELERLRDTQLAVGIPAARAFSELDEAVRHALEEARALWRTLPSRADPEASRLDRILTRLEADLLAANRTADERAGKPKEKAA